MSAEIAKVLILMNNNELVMSTFDYLKKHEYEIKFIHNLMESVNAISTFKPDVLILSWNLKGVNIKKVHKIFKSKTDSICIIFAEENNSRTTTSLMASGIPNTVLPPLSGVNIHMRIQGLLRNKNSQSDRANDKRKAPSKKVNINWDNTDSSKLHIIDKKKISSNEVPKETQWIVKVDAQLEEDQIWMGSATIENKERFFYFKGGNPSVLFNEVQRGTRQGKSHLIMTDREVDDSGLIMFQKVGSDVKFQVTQEAPEEMVSGVSEVSSKLTVDDNSLEIALLEAFETESETTIEKDETAEKTVTVISILEQCLIKAIDNVLVTETQEKSEQIRVLNQVTASVIKSSRYSGYLLSGTSSNLPDYELAKKVYDQLKIEMGKSGEDLSDICGVLELRTEPIQFEIWAESQADFLVKSQIGKEEIIFAFLPVDSLPKFSDIDGEDFSKVALKYFEGGQAILFDIYMRLPKNDKYLRYLKKGTVLSTKTLQRLNSYDLENLFIRRADYPLLYAYCAKIKFLRSQISFKKDAA